jgi:hypothetical protein
MYTPPHAITDVSSYSNVIVGIQGPPGSGKTTSALSFPNPVVALFERPDFRGVLQELPHLKDVKPVILPFYDADFILNKLKQPKSGEHFDAASAFVKWVQTESIKLTQQQTLVIDNWTRLQEQFDKVNWSAPLYPTYSRKGEIDDFAPWARKIDFAESVSNALLQCKCNIVVIFHEVQEREQGTGRLLDKIQPLMQGKFVAKLKSYYPNFFRQRCVITPVKDKDGKIVDEKREYMWQTKGSLDFDAKCSWPNLPALVPAVYQSLTFSPKQ